MLHDVTNGIRSNNSTCQPVLSWWCRDKENACQRSGWRKSSVEDWEKRQPSRIYKRGRCWWGNWNMLLFPKDYFKVLLVSCNIYRLFKSRPGIPKPCIQHSKSWALSLSLKSWTIRQIFWCLLVPWKGGGVTHQLCTSVEPIKETEEWKYLVPSQGSLNKGVCLLAVSP